MTATTEAKAPQAKTVTPKTAAPKAAVQGKPAQAKPQRGLGKGLSALMSEDYSDQVTAGVSGMPPLLPVEKIDSGRFQPRSHFNREQLQELADSISKNGVMQPIVVRPHPEKQGFFEIIAGERRWRASKLAGLSEIPAIVRNIEDQQALELALVENIQRQDLTPIEEAAGYQRLMDEFSYTQEELSFTVGKSRSHIANMVRILALPQEVKAMVDEDKISMGHARTLLKAEKPLELAQEIVRRGLNVRQAENIARNGLPQIQRKARTSRQQGRAGSAAGNAAPVEKDADILALEETLSDNLGLKVSIEDRGASGAITIAYSSLEELDEVLRRLGGSI